MTPDAANAQVPYSYWRQRCYRIVTNMWFDCFIYFAILCNTPVILCEVALKPPINYTGIIIIKILNL